MSSIVDYSLARKRVLTEFASGRVGQPDICDAHPELVRAANYSGRPAGTPCPVCAGRELKLVSYAFSEDLKKDNGRLWPESDIAGLLRLKEPRLYTVEVCCECTWNHLRTQMIYTGRAARSRISR